MKRWREWVVTLGGILLPICLYGYIRWGMGYSFTEPFTQFAEAFLSSWTTPAFLEQWKNPLLWLHWALLLTLTIWSLIAFAQQIHSMRTRPYKSYLYFIWILFFSIAPLCTPALPVKKHHATGNPACRHHSDLLQSTRKPLARNHLSAPAGRFYSLSACAVQPIRIIQRYD